VLLQMNAWAPFALAAVALPLLSIPTVRAMRARETFASPPPGEEPARLADLAREAMRPGVRSLLAAQALWVLGYAALPSFFILYADHVLGIGPGAAGLWLVLFGALTGGTMVLAGRARDPRHHRGLVVGGVVLLGAGLLAAGWASTLLTVAPGLASAAIGFGLVSTVGFPLFAALIPPGETGRHTALYFSVRAIAGAIALPAVGWTVAVTGSYRSMLLGGAVVTLAALLPLGVRLRAPGWLRSIGAGWLARFAASLAALGAVVLGVGLLVAETPLAAADEALFRTLNGAWHGPDALWSVLNPHTPNYIALLAVAALLAAVADRRRILAVIGFAALSWVVAVGLQQQIHRIWDRPRPEEVLGAGEVVLDGNTWAHLASYPSGHAVATAALVAAIGRAFPLARVPLWTYLVAVAASRVLFGAHFPSDVIVGLVLGYVVARAVEALLARAGLLTLPIGLARYPRGEGDSRTASPCTAVAASHPSAAPRTAPAAMSRRKWTPR
jgi:membrane-associated phospholipid phosphatase